MAHKTDAITRWWRGTSLRAKVTAVTVALLAVGLFTAGIGTAAFLRTALMNSIDAQVSALAGAEAAAPLLEFVITDGEVRTRPRDNVAGTEYFVAVYSPIDGAMIGQAGGRGGPAPMFPETVTLDEALSLEGVVFLVETADGEAQYKATRSVQQFAEGGVFYSQVVAVPVAAADRTMATYVGIYGILAILIIVIGAFATRWLVTLTFRSLGQVESTAEAIAAGDFSLRMTEIEPTTTEVGRLKTAINAMLGRVDAAISERDATVRQMRRFIGDASHELRTPLVTVRGYAELYRMGAITGDDDVAQAMGRIESEAKRMGLLVEDLLALARLDERSDVVVAPVDLRPIARDAALDVRATSPQRVVSVIDTTVAAPVAAEPDPAPAPEPEPESERRRPPTRPLARAGASLSLLRRRPKPVPARSATGLDQTPSAPPPRVPAAPSARGGVAPIVLGDENRVRQVVANLLGNARRFTPESSPIELRVGVSALAGEGWIEIVDHGEGVPDQIKEKIFQRFWRADTSRARETGGSGLGLSIVASIVASLSGSVTVLDTPGGGATFRVTLPLAPHRDAVESLQMETQPLERLDLSRGSGDNPRAD